MCGTGGMTFLQKSILAEHLIINTTLWSRKFMRESDLKAYYDWHIMEEQFIATCIYSEKLPYGPLEYPYKKRVLHQHFTYDCVFWYVL